MKFDRLDPPSIRWWPLALTLLSCAGVLGFIWLVPEEMHRQQRVQITMMVGSLTGILVLLWWLFASRLAWRVKIRGLIVVAVVVGGFFASFRRVGFTGDLVPLLEWRWSTPPPDELRTAAQAISVPHADYPEFLGNASRSGTLASPLAEDWEARPPELIWARSVGEAFSGFAIAGSDAITMEQEREHEFVRCYEFETGQLRWEVSRASHYSSSIAGVGPRATPTIHERHVFTLGAMGVLLCLAREDGSVLWERSLPDDHGAVMPEWGFTSSPLVLNDRVIVQAGGPDGHSLVAHHVRDGRPVWYAGNDSAGYGSPMLARLHGVAQVLVLTNENLVGHDPETGAILWQFPWDPPRPNCAQPLVLEGNRILVSTGYDVGAALVQVVLEEGQWSATRVWKSRRLKSKFANMIAHEHAIYGLDDGMLTCLNATNGQRLWKDGRFGHGQLLNLGERLLVQTEHGEIHLIAFARDELRVLTSFQAVDGRTWNPPALADPFLLVRSERRAVLYRLAK